MIAYSLVPPPVLGLGVLQVLQSENLDKIKYTIEGKNSSETCYTNYENLLLQILDVKFSTFQHRINVLTILSVGICIDSL